MLGIIGLVVLVIKPDVNPSQAFPFIIDYILPSGLKGLAVVGMLAIIMSTADSFLNVSAISFVHDFLKPFFGNRMNDKSELFLARITTFFVGMSAILVAAVNTSVIDILLNFLSFWGPTIVIPLYAGIFCFRSTGTSFIAAFIAGFSTFVVWILFDLEKQLGFDSLFPSIFLNFVTFFTVRYYIKTKQKSKILNII